MKMHKLDSAARDWLVAALDPFHDNQLQLEGLPDMMSAPSIVKMYNQTYTLTHPTSVAAGNWDATIAFTGCTSEIGANPTPVVMPVAGAVANNDLCLTYDHTSYTAQGTFGTFVVKAGAAGAALPWGAPFTANDTNLAFGAVSLDPSSDRARVIGVAFEVVNTTADIYKQGSVTVAALPGQLGDSGNVLYVDLAGAGPNPNITFQGWTSPKYASTQAALIGVPGACTWAAREGVYAIPRMVTHTMPVENPSVNKRTALIQDSSSGTTFYGSTPVGHLAVGALNIPFINGVGSSGFAAVQSFFTGLSFETSLVIKMRTIVEHFPGFGSALLPLCHPSPAFSPRAFEIYSGICREAPYAVMVKENGAGEYFRRILSLASRVGSALAPLAGPYAGIVSVASSAGSAIAKKLEERAAAAKVAAKPKQIIVTQKALKRVSRRAAGAPAMPSRQ